MNYWIVVKIKDGFKYCLGVYDDYPSALRAKNQFKDATGIEGMN